MKTFKTIEEIIEFVSDKENIETLENGELTLKAWSDESKAFEKSKKDYGQATNERKTLRGKNEELTKKVTELTEQLNSVNNELSGLKEVQTGGDKDALQKLIKEKSELLTKNNAVEAENRDLKTLIPELEKKVESYKAASNRSRILEEKKKAAIARKVPQNIIDDPDFFEKVVVDEFIVDDMGNIFTKGDSPLGVNEYIAAKQRDRPHWKQDGSGDKQVQPICEYGAVSDEIAAIASLFSPGTSGGKPMQSISAGGFLSDDLIAIAKLFG
jgi:uncharacterized phage infection (PIP) family protein YhgE